MDSDERRDEAVVGRAQPETEPAKKQPRNSTLLVLLGVILFFTGGALASNNPEGGLGGLLFGILGVGLIVAGIVTRSRR